MGFLGDLGMPKLTGSGGGIHGFGQGALIIVAVFVILIFSGIITFFYYSKKIQKKQFKHKIIIFKEINGKISRIGADDAKEIYIPDSNISLYYLKKKKIYIARPTRAMNLDEYWYLIAENGEWINYDLSVVPGQNTLAKANYDHRDTRYAYINLKDIIKRNYSDKSVKWWKEYAPLITFIICFVIGVAGLWILFAKMGKLVTQLGTIAEQFKTISANLADAVNTQQNLNSGVIAR